MSYNIVNDVRFTDESSTYPVTLQEAKDYCRIGLSNDDVDITLMIKAATQTIEQYTKLSLITRTVTAIISNPCGYIELPFGPVTNTPTFANTTDEANKEFIGLDFIKVKNPTYEDMEIEYTAGYETVPFDLKQAILAQILYLYEMRGDESTETRGVCAASVRLANKHSRIPAIS